MYYITYKNVLKQNKDQHDFKRWLHDYWPIQQSWGATSFKLWNSTQNDSHILFLRYTVKNIDKWNQKAMSNEAWALNEALSKIVDIDQMSMKISVLPNRNA